MRTDHVHGESSDQVVAVHLRPDIVGDQHDRQQRDKAGEYEAVDTDDNGCALQVFQLGVREFPIYLRQRFFAAHGEHGVPEADDESQNAEHVRQFAVLPEAERFVAIVNVGQGGEGRQVAAYLEQGEKRPAQQHHHHDGRDLHDPERLFAGFFDALDVFPPEVERDGHGKHNRGAVNPYLRSAVEEMVDGGGDPAMGIGDADGVVDQASDVLSRGYAGDRPGKDVIEHQGRDTELGERAAESFFNDPIDAAPHKHRAAFHVNGADRESEQHDAQNKPRGALANCLFRDATGIERRRTEIVENDGGGSPVGDEGEHHRGRNHNANPVVTGGCV